MTFPIMTRDIAFQLEQSRADFIESWLQGLREQPGNPYGVDVRRIGNARAFVARSLAEIGLFNQVIGFGSQDKELLDEIIDWYCEHGVKRYRLDVNPYSASPDFLAHLASHEFFQSSFQTYMCGLPTSDPPFASTAVAIREVAYSEVDLFADIHVEGFREVLSHLPEETVRRYRESTKVLSRLSGWHLYLVLVNDTPCGIGMLYIQNGIASLAGGATLPQFRQHGCQTAVLRHRMIVAAYTHCSLVVGQASVGSTSQQNMERLGVRTAYTGTLWTPVLAQ